MITTQGQAATPAGPILLQTVTMQGVIQPAKAQVRADLIKLMTGVIVLRNRKKKDVIQMQF